MTWVRLEPTMPHHPKVVAAGLQAFGFDAAAICYSNLHGTDGFIADAILPVVFPGAPQPGKLAKRLVQVGRWRRDNERGGWWIHDIADYQPSAAEQAAAAAKRSEIGRRAADARWHGAGNGRGDASGMHDAYATHASSNASSHAPSNAHAMPRPVPSRSGPTVKESSVTFSNAVHRAVDDDGNPIIANAVWQAFADAKERLAGGSKPPAWRARVLANAEQEHAERARRLLADTALAEHEIGEILAGTRTLQSWDLRQADAG